MITAYIYEPLVGLKKKIDPNGIEENYEYDGFNRLRFIRDHNGDIVKRYTYKTAD